MTKNPEHTDALAAALRDLAPLDATAALIRLQALVRSEPDFRAVRDDYTCPPETLKWIGELQAVVSAMKRLSDDVAVKTATGLLIKSRGSLGGDDIRAVLYRSLAAAELAAPASAQGSFVAAGNQFDAYAAISKILASAAEDLLVVDPYADSRALTEFMTTAGEGVKLRILADEGSAKPTLMPAAERWIAQFGNARPLEVRLSAPRSLHDRLIVVDQREAWSLTQSLKDFANRAHGSIMKADAELRDLKIQAYGALWDAARPL